MEVGWLLGARLRMERVRQGKERKLVNSGTKTEGLLVQEAKGRERILSLNIQLRC